MSNSTLPEIGFIGVGEMGAPMVHNLLRAGFSVHIFDLDAARLQPLVGAGAHACHSGEECVRCAGWICASLPSSAAFVAVADKVLLPHVREGQIVLDFGTTIPFETRRLAAEFRQRGAHLLDVPVSGGVHGAQQAKLKMFVGGDESTLQCVRPLLEVIGGPDDIHFCGPSGAGQVVKGVNQLLMGLMAASCLETLSFGVRGGVDMEVLAKSLDGPEAWRKYFAGITNQALRNGGESIGVKFRELPYFLSEIESLNSELPLTKTLWEFCDRGERVMTDDHRAAPSFWHELMRQKEEL